LDAHAGAVIWVSGKTRRRGGLLPARRNNAAWRPERGAGGCIALSFIRWTPSKPSTIAFMRLGKRYKAVNCRF